jgi:hypothetical protein
VVCNFHGSEVFWKVYHRGDTGWRYFLDLFCRTFDVMSPRHCDENEKEIEMIMGD